MAKKLTATDCAKGVLGWAVIIAIGWAFWSSSETDEPETAAVAEAQKPTSAKPLTIRSEIPGCQTWDVYDRMVKIATDGDTEAFRKHVAMSILSGDCRLFRAGDEVFIDDSSITSLRVRPKGEVKAYWVPRDQVR